MSGHTPGPWKLHAGFGDYRVVVAADGTPIVRMTASARKIEDARLIAAAPDLLADMENIAGRRCETTGSGIVRCGVDGVACSSCVARAALEKARSK